MRVFLLSVLFGAGLLGAPPRVRLNVSVAPAAARPGERVELRLDFEVQPDWHIYAPNFTGTGKPTRLTMERGPVSPTGSLSFPEPRKRREEVLEEDVLYHEGKFRYVQSLRVAENAPPEKVTIRGRVTYQACSDTSCDPPLEAPVEAGLEILAPGGQAAAPEPETAPPKEGSQSWIGFILAAIVAGLVTLVMPCTYPMIPITISFFTKQAEARHTGVLPLALAYGAGIVVDFVLIGLIVGQPILTFATHPVTNTIFALLFIVFGLSLIGLFEIRLPGSMNALAGRAMGVGGYTGVFLMGATLAITSFTCTAPFVGSLLFATGAQARSFGQILVGMTFFGLTMALPFVGLALFPDLKRSLPRSGEWIHTLKVTLGFIELAAALKFISNVDVALRWYILPQELFLYLVAAISLTTALYLFGMVRLRGESGEVGPLRLVWGMLFLIAALYFFHYTEVKHPNWLMAAFLPPYSSSEPLETSGAPGRVKETPTAVEWTLAKDDFEGGLEKAQAEGKLALVNWTGDL